MVDSKVPPDTHNLAEPDRVQDPAQLGRAPQSPTEQDDGTLPVGYTSHVRRTRSSAPEVATRGTDLAPGFSIGAYIVETVAGRGGMGTVYTARHHSTGAPVAIKILGDTYAQSPVQIQRFIDEARAVNQINHPNIIDIFSFGQLPDGRHYYVMEKLQGQTLRDRIEAGPCAQSEIRSYARDICHALAAAHERQIVHRDLKPENIWLSRTATGAIHVKLLDFGMAKLLDRNLTEALTQTGATLGTPLYMSPEQCRGTAVDTRSDIYALGVILYELFTGVLPFEATSMMDMLAHHMSTPAPRPSSKVPLQPAIDQLVSECLAKTPAARPQQAQFVWSRLEQALDDPTRIRTEPQLTASAPTAQQPEPAATATYGGWVGFGVLALLTAGALWLLR